MQLTPHDITEANGGSERRERPRHAPSSLSYVSVDDANGGVIVDISEMGMAISPVEPISSRAPHTLRFQLPRMERMFETPASLVWTSDTKPNVGVRFDSLSVEDRLQIRNWVKDELFAEAFPTRAAARTTPRRKPAPSQDTLGYASGPRAANLTTTNGTMMKATTTTQDLADGSLVGAARVSAREATPRVPKKELSDLHASMTADRSSEFEKLFPSERTLTVELQPRPGKSTRSAESASSIDTAALWMNFPSEAELARRSAAVDDEATVIATPDLNETPAVEAATQVEQVEIDSPAALHENEAAPVEIVAPVEVADEVVAAHADEVGGAAVASAESTEVAAASTQAEPVETAANFVARTDDEVPLPSVETSASTDLSVPMAAASAELEEAQRVDELVASPPAAAVPTPVNVRAAQRMEFEVPFAPEPINDSEIYEFPAEGSIEAAAPKFEEAVPLGHDLQSAAAEAIPGEVEAASRAETQIAEDAPAESQRASHTEIVQAVESTVAIGAVHIEVPPELLAPPLAFASEAPISHEIFDAPVHELNPEPHGPEVAANRLDLLDISQAVRAPGKFSTAIPVSDASIDSLLAIAEEEVNTTRRTKALKVVPDRKRELLPNPEDPTFAQLSNATSDASAIVQRLVAPTVANAAIAALATDAAANGHVTTPEPVAAAVANPVRKSVANPVVAALARPVAPIASANALPHVALRSASQQSVHHDLLGDGDKKYRGLLFIAIFVLLAGCFAIGYSRHVGIEWQWNSSGTAATNGKIAATNAQPAAATASTSTDSSSAAPAIRNPTTITSPGKNSGTTPLPDASNVQPDAKFEASAPPTPQASAPSFFPITAPSEGEAPRMLALPEEQVFDSPRVEIRLRQDFFVPSQPGPEWKHSLERIQIGEALSKTPPAPASQSDAGIVHVRATVGADGTVKSVRPIDGPVALIPRSMDAIRKWRYQPSLLDGQPLEWQGDFSIEFRPAR